MSSKTILIGLGVLRCGGEKSVHGRHSRGISLRTTVVHKTLKILPRGVNLCQRNAASMITLESEEWFGLQHIFLLISDKAKALPIRACLHGGGGPQEGEVTRSGGVTRLSIWSLILIWLHLHDRWGDPTRRVARSAGVKFCHVNVQGGVTRLAGVRFVIHQIGAKFTLVVVLHYY